MPGRPDHFKLFAVGGILLASVAGFVNAVTILTPLGVTATHVTGTVTRAAVAIADPRSGLNAGLALALVAAFLGGSAVTGAVVDSTRLHIGARYGVLLMLESGLLTVAAIVLGEQPMPGMMLAAFASGLQNALATQYSNAIVRTTHVTGIVTDLGIALGKWVARRGVEWWRVQLYVGLVTGFVAGGMLGALAWETYGSRALLIPAVFLSVMGLAHWLVRDRIEAIRA